MVMDSSLAARRRPTSSLIFNLDPQLLKVLDSLCSVVGASLKQKQNWKGVIHDHTCLATRLHAAVTAAFDEFSGSLPPISGTLSSACGRNRRSSFALASLASGSIIGQRSPDDHAVDAHTVLPKVLKCVEAMATDGRSIRNQEAIIIVRTRQDRLIWHTGEF